MTLLPSLPKVFEPQKYIEELKVRIQEKDSKICELEACLKKPSVKGSPPEPMVSSYLSPEQRVNKVQMFLKDLDKQLEVKEQSRIQSTLEKEKELRASLAQLRGERLRQIKQKLANSQRSENYRNDLYVQQQMKDQVTEAQLKAQELYQPLVRFRHLKQSWSQSLCSPKLSPDETLPRHKNLNTLVSYSNLPAFQQPVYTKHHPKLQPSYPITGSSLF